MSVLKEWSNVSLENLNSLADELKDLLNKPSVVILTGPVGAGKTTFTQHFSGAVGSTSPSYSLINDLGEMSHADFYRINSPEDIYHLELSLYAEDKDYFFIEWGKDYLDQVKSELPEGFSYYELSIEKQNDGTENEDRQFSLTEI
jgi:tRNA threonylcarbamoyladenosine biosynthesis protein TsaE